VSATRILLFDEFFAFVFQIAEAAEARASELHTELDHTRTNTHANRKKAAAAQKVPPPWFTVLPTNERL